MYRILLVEDDLTISQIIEGKLKKWGYEVLRVRDFNNILIEYSSFDPHMILLDINLPYYDGFYWCAKIRQVSQVPIVFISSKDSDGDKIRAISQGGDDYIEKPFSMDLLVVKIQAVLRRTYSYADTDLHIVQYNDLILDIEKFQLMSTDETVELTRNECKILTILIRNQGRIVSRTRIIKALWDDESFVDDNTLTVNVNRLRKKIENLGITEIIKTVKGEGYKLT